jgi:hypothetical protein
VKTYSCAAILAILLGVAQPLVCAHHAFSAEFDAAKPVTLAGTVAKVAWTNPHAHIHVDVADRAGKVTTWDFELGSPNALMRRGWSARSLKPGDQVTVNGYLAKDGSSLANARSITLSDGHELFAGPSNESPAGR